MAEQMGFAVDTGFASKHMRAARDHGPVARVEPRKVRLALYQKHAEQCRLVFPQRCFGGDRGVLLFITVTHAVARFWPRRRAGHSGAVDS